MDSRIWQFAGEKGLSVGIPEVDTDHIRFISLTQGLSDTITNHLGLSEINRNLQLVIDDAERHFAKEEAVLRQWKHPDAEAHALMHRQAIGLRLNQIDGGLLVIEVRQQEHLVTHAAFLASGLLISFRVSSSMIRSSFDYLVRLLSGSFPEHDLRPRLAKVLVAEPSRNMTCLKQIALKRRSRQVGRAARTSTNRLASNQDIERPPVENGHRYQCMLLSIENVSSASLCDVV